MILLLPAPDLNLTLFMLTLLLPPDDRSLSGYIEVSPDG